MSENPDARPALHVVETVDDGRRKPRVRTINAEESKTVQSDRHRAEIKHVLAQYEATGLVPHLQATDLAYRDVTEFTDYGDVMRELKAAEEQFNRLPPQLREVFDNDPARWLDVAHDAEKQKEIEPRLIELGIIEAPPEPPAPAPPPAPTPPPAPEA